MAIVEQCPNCKKFTNLRNNSGCCAHCGCDVEGWWEENLPPYHDPIKVDLEPPKRADRKKFKKSK